MNERKAYEQTIKGKLEAIPLPDMENAIWTRIETQLDIDMPTDDSEGDAPSPNNPSGFGWIGGAGIIIFVVALISIFITNNKTNTESSPTPTETSITPSDTVTPSITPTINQDDDPLVVSPSNSLSASPIDTSNASAPNLAPPFVAPVADDTTPAVSRAPDTNLILPDSTAPKKKGRGVQGINDDDYRIVPAKRDSS